MSSETPNQHPSCDICHILDTAGEDERRLRIVEGDHWFATLRGQDQTLLGTTFVTLKRHEYEVDRLSPDENSEFLVIQSGLIRAIRQCFSPITFNISNLKNDAFKAAPDNTDPESAHVHYHLKPRYRSQPVVFMGETFVDPLPGQYLSSYERKRVSQELAQAITDTVFAALPLEVKEINHIQDRQA